MPMTRALSAHSRGSQNSQEPKKSVDEKDELMNKSTVSTYSDMELVIEMPKCKPAPKLASLSSRHPMTRTCSMPVIDHYSSWSEVSTRYGAQRTSSKRCASTGMRSSLSSMSSSASSHCSSSRRGGSDDSDDDDERDRTPITSSARLGGCSRLSEARTQRDDSNKENVAPLRRMSQSAVRQEQVAHQADMVMRRTRRQAARPMSDRSDSLPPSTAVATATTAAAGGHLTSLLSRSSFRRTASTPSSLRKRGRPVEDDFLNVRSMNSPSDLPSPSSRARLDCSSDEQESCYFSSQAASIFDSSSVSSPLSRCTTPEPTEVDVEEKKQEQDADDASFSSELTSSPLPSYSNIFVHARALLRYGVTKDVHIVGRDRERGALQRFLNKRFGLFTHLEHSAMPNGESLCNNVDGATDSGSLYVCGLPGTGKTALVRSVLADIQQMFPSHHRQPRVAFIDCMTIQHPKELFKRILIALDENVGSLPCGETGDLEAEQRATKIVKDANRQTLIVLDEIDHLLRSRVHQNILYRLFSWPQRDSQSCALIGMANSLDLTERFVPLLASKGAAPAVLHFRPFEADEIKTVIGSRLALLRSRYDEQDIDEDEHCSHVEEGVALFSPPALELVARKIAAATGDLRKALDASRLAVEAVEAEYLRKARNDAESAAIVVDLRHLTPQSAPKVLPSHVLKVVSAVLGSPQLTKIRSLSLQPKLALLALLIAQKRESYGLNVLGGGGSGVSVGRSTMGNVCTSNTQGTLMCDVESTYTAMLKSDDFAALEGKELVDVLEGLEVEGVVRIVGLNGQSSAQQQQSGNNPSSPERAKSTSSFGGNVSPSAKRAAKRQLLASYRRVELSMPVDDVVRGITTVAPASRSSSAAAAAAAAPDNGIVACSAVVVDAIKRIWTREEDKADHAKGWEVSAALAQRVRDEELGGGRGAIGL